MKVKMMNKKFSYSYFYSYAAIADYNSIMLLLPYFTPLYIYKFMK